MRAATVWLRLHRVLQAYSWDEDMSEVSSKLDAIAYFLLLCFGKAYSAVDVEPFEDVLDALWRKFFLRVI